MTQEAGLENFWGMSAYAQESTAGDLKSKGATVLSAEEVKDLLSGATVRYEGPQYRTQAKLNADGTVSGSVQNRVGTAGGLPLMGKWNVNDQGRWCADVGQTPQGGTKFAARS